MIETSKNVPRRAVSLFQNLILTALLGQINFAFSAGKAYGNDGQAPQPKFPMSWRVTAYGMSSPANLASAKAKANCSLSISYNEVGKYLNPTLNQLGLSLVSAFPQAGQYLAVPSGLSSEDQSKGQLIIVAQPIGDNQTLLQTKLIGDSRFFDLKKVDDIPSLMSTMVQRKGLM
jgi:hypothetical protein